MDLDFWILSGETKTLSVAKRCAVEDGTPPLKVGVSSVELPSEENEYLGSSNTPKVKKKQHKGTKKELQQVMEESVGGKDETSKDPKLLQPQGTFSRDAELL